MYVHLGALLFIVPAKITSLMFVLVTYNLNFIEFETQFEEKRVAVSKISIER